MTDATHAIFWAADVLQQQGLRAKIDVAQVVDTPFSCVKKLTCGSDVFYLKQTPPPLFIEAAIITFLRNTCGITAIPEIIAQDDTLHCFIMPPCGGDSLRTRFATTFDMGLFLAGMQTYKDIQRATKKHIDTLLQMGVPDWRMQKLPTRYHSMIHDADFMKRCAMTDEQVKQLQSLQPEFEKICAAIDAFNIPDCLNHSDFQANNILGRDDGKNVSVIDWGEVTIGNPLLTMGKYFKTVCDSQQFDADTYRAVEKKFYGDYFRSDADMRVALEHLGKIAPVYYVFTLMRLEELTQQTNEKWNGRINGALTAFLAQSF